MPRLGHILALLATLLLACASADVHAYARPLQSESAPLKFFAAAETAPSESAHATPSRVEGFCPAPGKSTSSLGVTGYQKDPTTGLYYAGARFYDPLIGGFDSMDPVRGNPNKPLSFNPYLYAYGNPTIYVDPTGRAGVFTWVRDRFDSTDQILREWAVSSGDSNTFAGTVGYVLASASRPAVGLASVPFRLGNLQSDVLAQSAPVRWVAPDVANKASAELGGTVDTVAFINEHPVEATVGVGLAVADNVKRVWAGDRGAGSDMMSVSFGFLIPSAYARVEQAVAASFERQVAENIRRSVIERGLATRGQQQLPPPPKLLTLQAGESAEGSAPIAQMVLESGAKPSTVSPVLVDGAGNPISVNKYGIPDKSFEPHPSVTEPYARKAAFGPTEAQVASVQGKPCVVCRNEEPTMVADHIDALSVEHYRTGTVNVARQTSLEAVQSHCQNCSNIQGGYASAFSRAMKKKIAAPKRDPE